ncbi:MAG TPA: hypothetical protein VFL14_15085 [Xanthomonadales bacterium]|nr:hypothetical protein [Xanthomonadales bacterium]
MKLESQIRRGVFGFAAFLALGLVAVAHGGQVRDGGMPSDAGMAQCDVLPWPVAPIADRGDSESHTDWRALLPAMMFPTRS